MLLLSFETSAKAASVALFDEEKLLGESYQLTALTHSQTLMVMAEDLMKQCSVTVKDLTHVAVAAGPACLELYPAAETRTAGQLPGADRPECGSGPLRL